MVNEYDLCDLLSEKLRSRLVGIRDACKEIWKAPILQHFTDHGLEHSEKIIVILRMLLGSKEEAEQRITEHELFILFAAAYLHDIGMQSAFHDGLLSKDHFTLEDAEAIRKQHHESSYKIIMESVDPTAPKRIKCGLEQCTEPNYVRYIAILSASHRKNMPGISSDRLRDDRLETGKTIRLRFLVALLRLADELDRDYRRVSMDRLNLQDIPTESKVYWWMHHYTKAVDITNGIIKVMFRLPEIYREKSPEIAEFIFSESIEAIKNQLLEVHKVLWDEEIKLQLISNDPQSDAANFAEDPNLRLLPDELIDFLKEKNAMKRSAEDFGEKEDSTIWLDGIAETDDKELKILTSQALEYAKKEEHAKAVEYIEKALLITVTASERAALKNLIGGSLLVIGKTKESIINFQDVLVIAERFDSIEIKTVVIEAFNQLSKIYHTIGDLKSALNFHGKAIRLSREIGDRQGEAKALGNISNISSDKGETDEALKYLKEALKIDREIGYRQGEAFDLSNISNIYSDKGETDEALKYLKEALKIDREIGYRQGEAAELGNIGNIYSAKDEADEALKYHQKALKINREISRRPSEAADLRNIGNIYSDKGETEEALKYLKKAFAIMDTYGVVSEKNIVESEIKKLEKVTQK